ncbi:recombinase family protein [Chordicoccus furentiruminis]|uniref:recombinase family protein n=1 Tax=Chordicoccus furentiruminis TaxID=2709410 RepID=UPI0023A8278C|nr:recombinase family protein [Chordicoccus furentiruminis]
MAKQVTKIPATVSQFTAAPINSRAKRKVAGYARVSTDHDEQLTSYEAQLDYYTTLIQGHDDWEFAGMYSDEGITGTSVKKREGFQSMVADALAGKIDLIITKSVSRFARNTVDSLSTIRELKEHNTEVYFEKENIWTFDSKGELLITIMSSLAQEESRSISENVTWGHRKRMADGKVSIPFSTFIGYDKGEDGTLVVNPEQAKIIKLIFGEYLAGLSCHAIADKLTTMGIKTPRGKDKWSQTTVKSILQNEKYKGDALLQKYYTPDFLTKKQVHNNGEIPQYYVENNHEAIIEPEIFDRVQDIFRERSKKRGYSGVTIFSSKVQCGNCGAWYGSKVWHSTDRYRKVVWQCNAKFKDKTRCATPHLTEDEIKDAFIRVVNSLVTDKDEVLAELKAVQAELSGTKELEAEQRRLAEQMNVDADAVQEIIAVNARVAQDQAEYNVRYEALVSRFETTKAQYEKVTAEITAKGVRRREFGRFIQSVEKLPKIVTEFDEALWGSLVDHLTVYSKDNMVFTLSSGMEIKA